MLLNGDPRRSTMISKRDGLDDCTMYPSAPSSISRSRPESTVGSRSRARVPAAPHLGSRSKETPNPFENQETRSRSSPGQGRSARIQPTVQYTVHCTVERQAYPDRRAYDDCDRSCSSTLRSLVSPAGCVHLTAADG
nr:hypothetical protein CFP56_55976 [Quercus suber]